MSWFVDTDSSGPLSLSILCKEVFDYLAVVLERSAYLVYPTKSNRARALHGLLPNHSHFSEWMGGSIIALCSLITFWYSCVIQRHRMLAKTHRNKMSRMLSRLGSEERLLGILKFPGWKFCFAREEVGEWEEGWRPEFEDLNH